MRPSDTLTPAMIWRAVQHWWPWALATGFVLAVIGDAIVLWTFKPTYRATARLAIKDQADYLAFKSSEPSGRFVQNQVELIRSPQVLEKVLEKQDIAQFQEILEQPSPFEWLQKNVMVKNLGGSEFFELSFADSDATHAAAIANAICDSFYALSNERTSEQTTYILQTLKKEQERCKTNVDQLREKVRTLSKQLTGKDPFSPVADQDKNETHSPLATLQDRLALTEVEHAEIDARIKAAEEVLATATSEAPADALDRLIDARPEIVRLQEDLAADRARFEEAQRVARPNFSEGLTKFKTQVDADEQRIKEAREKLRASMAKEYIELEANKRKVAISELRDQSAKLIVSEKFLHQQVEKLIEGRVQVGENTLELETAKADLARAESVYQRIADRILALSTETLAPERVSRGTRASVPAEAEVKSPIRMLGMVTLAGLALPFVLAIVWERRVRRVVDPQQVMDETTLSVIGEISSLPVRHASGNDSKTVDWARHVFEESVDSLRTTLVLSDQLKALKAIAVVSAVSQEGKTSLSAQLAISLARACGQPVLLIDADMRSPDLHEMFDVPRDPGLAAVLSGGCQVREAIRSTDANPLIHILPAGRLVQNPHSLVSHDALKNVVDRMRADYRYIVIDTPPVLSASESLVIAKVADAALICALRDASRTGQVRLTYDRLTNSGSMVAGVVLSGVPTKAYSYRYGSYAYSGKH
jgi:capsular exopolysaccharide synthesis family protein